jgi:hypothetical protein
MCESSSTSARCAPSEPAKYASDLLCSASIGVDCATGLATDDTRNDVMPMLARMRPFVGMGSSNAPTAVVDGRACPDAATSASGVALPSTTMSPVMPTP